MYLVQQQWLIIWLKLVNLPHTEKSVISVHDLEKSSILEWEGKKKESVAFLTKESKSHCQSLILKIMCYEEHEYVCIYK